MSSDLKIKAFYRLNLTGALILLVFIPLNYYRGYPELSISNLVFIVLLALNTIAFRKHNNIQVATFICACAVIIFTALYLMILGLSMFFWIYITPVGAFIILKRKPAFIIVLLSTLVYSVVYFFIPANEPATNWIEFDLLFSYLFCILLAFAAHYFMQRDRDELERISSTDALTGALNRRKFADIFNRELSLTRRHQEKLSMILFDVDFFKNVNDQHGHQVGDQVLIELARLVQEQLRIEDYLFRWGGEEFLMLLPMTTLHDARHLADRLREYIARHEFAHKQPLTASFGVTEYAHQQHSHDLSGSKDRLMDVLVQEADRALYAAKHNGRNRVEAFSELVEQG